MPFTAFQNVVGMSLLLGAASYGVGLVPLSIPLSKKQLSVLSNLGTGLLVGTALGVILPEGIEELMANAERKQSSSFTSSVGIPILLGFALMFLLEEYTTSHCSPRRPQLEEPAFDIDLEERRRPLDVESTENSRIQRASPLSLGLIMHALVDGYALGVSASDVDSPRLSLVVFLAIIVHKAPTALALTTALLANSLSVTDCKKHLLYFSLATPVSAILSYGLYAFRTENRDSWSGSALLFSGGTFLYVASVIQPTAGEMNKMVRTALVVSGMFFPVLVGRFVVHGH